MSQNHNENSPAQESAENVEDPGQINNRGGSGAASALERMKADHALRHKHGARAAGPGHEDDQTPER
jgi:hypothetical protein